MSWLLATLHVLVFAAWGVSGLVAVLLAPGNPAARRLALAGGLLVATRVLDHLLVTDVTTRTAWRDAWWPRLLSELVFLGALAALVAALAVFPDGRYDRRTDRWLVRGLVATIALIGVLRLLASTEIATPTDGDAGAANPYASPALAPLDAVADALYATEPAWILTGAVLLVLRHLRGDAERRSELRWPLFGLLVLAAVLVLVLVGNATGLLGDGAVPEAAFLIALALFPAGLLASVVARVRAMESRLAASRIRLVEAEDAARRRVERDLHDGVQQQLTAIRSLVALAKRQAGRDPVLAAVTLDEIADETDDAMRDLRSVVSGIHPPVLTDHGLVPAIAARLRRMPQSSSLAAEEAAHTRWAPAVEGAAYFTVCEALANVGKHAGATCVEVAVERLPDGVLVRVQDDGRGYDPAAGADRGLLGVRDRVESLGGCLEIRSSRGEGTTLVARIPGGAR